MVKFKQQRQYYYNIYDNVGFPIGCIYNENFKVHLDLDVALSHTKLVDLLDEIKYLRDSYEIDVSYGDYVLGK